MTVRFSDALKAKKIREFFNRHGRIYILVDATADDVQLPEHLKASHALPLVLNTRMPQPIYIRDTFLESNFSFSGQPYHCVIPMNRIWAMYLPGEDLASAQVWEDDVPEMVRLMMEEQFGEQVQEEQEEQAQKEKQREEPADKQAQGRKVGHLRVVK